MELNTLAETFLLRMGTLFGECGMAEGPRASISVSFRADKLFFSNHLYHACKTITNSSQSNRFIVQ